MPWKHETLLCFLCNKQACSNEIWPSLDFPINFCEHLPFLFWQAISIMLQVGAKHTTCVVVGYTDQHTSLHHPRATEDSTVAAVGKNLLLCRNHFESDCFTNLGKYRTGQLFLKDGSVSTAHGKTWDDRNVSIQNIIMFWSSSDIKQKLKFTFFHVRLLRLHYLH